MATIVVLPKLKPLMDLIEARGFPATLYISFADWKAVRNFMDPALDEQGAFFWMLTTKVRVKRTEETVDVSGEILYPAQPQKSEDAA